MFRKPPKAVPKRRLQVPGDTSQHSATIKVYKHLKLVENTALIFWLWTSAHGMVVRQLSEHKHCQDCSISIVHPL